MVVSGKATGRAMAMAMVMAKGTAIIHNRNKMLDNKLKSKSLVDAVLSNLILSLSLPFNSSLECYKIVLLHIENIFSAMSPPLGRPTVHSCAEDLLRWTSSPGSALWQ